VHPEINMYKTDRSSAPLGLALLFLSLAIVPVSLRIAGYDVNVSPSLSAAVEAWRGVAGILGNSSQSATDTELSLVKKYSFAEEAPPSPEEPVVAQASNESVEPDFEPNVEASWGESAPLTPPTAPSVQCNAQPKARPKLPRSPVISQRVALVRLRHTIASALPALLRTAAYAEAKQAKCPESEGGVIRVRELVRRSHALGEAFKTVQLQKDVQVFVKMKPIALFAGTRLSMCDDEPVPIGEPATEVFRNAGPRFGVGASEEPESFEFLFDF
jgi:hypothetical protein